MDLIRELLLYFEEKPDAAAVEPSEISIPGPDSDDIAYHIVLLSEAGLLSHERVESTTTPSRLIKSIPFRLTWEGHEFLDSARNQSTWERAKTTLAAKGLATSYELLKALLLSYGKQQLGLS
ncbi:MAG: DUF2513 domain-containing protein [Gemmatimonadota bacterium]